MKVLSLEVGRFGDSLKACVKLPYGDYIISVTTEGAGVRVYDKEDDEVFVDNDARTIESAIDFIETREWFECFELKE